MTLRLKIVCVPDARAAKITLRTPPFLQAGGQLSVETASQFVERQPELARLEGWLARTSAGNGMPGFILGDPGSGKTTLMAEFARRAQEIYPDLLVAGGQLTSSAARAIALDATTVYWVTTGQNDGVADGAVMKAPK